MTTIYVPISQRNRNIKENQQRYISKLVGDGWIHEGLIKMRDIFGTEIECVVLVGDGLHQDCKDDKIGNIS